MEKIVYALVYNRKKRLNAQGKALVQVEAYLNKQRRYFSTKVYLKPEQWDKRRRLVKCHPNAKALNQRMWDFICKLEEQELDMWQQEGMISLSRLDVHSTQSYAQGSFIDFYRREVSNALIKESTRTNHLGTLKILIRFKERLSFEELSFDFLLSFEKYMQQEGYHINTIGKHMRHLKRYINVATLKGLLPAKEVIFKNYRIKSVESKHTHLHPEELKRLEGLVLPDKLNRLRKSLDAFLFCCYAGLRFSDFTHLRGENIVKNGKETWLNYRSVKTDIPVRLPLHLLFEGKAIEVLRRYMRNLDDFFRLHDNSNVNKDLLRIAKLCGLKKQLTFHVARHTNATLLIYKGVNITTVQKLLGHKNIKTTQVYTNIMDVTVLNDLQKHKK